MWLRRAVTVLDREAAAAYATKHAGGGYFLVGPCSAESQNAVARNVATPEIDAEVFPSPVLQGERRCEASALPPSTAPSPTPETADPRSLREPECNDHDVGGHHPSCSMAYFTLEANEQLVMRTASVHININTI